MMLDTVRPTIVISDVLIGWEVTIVPELDFGDYHLTIGVLEYARAYAHGLAAGNGWPIVDEATEAAMPGPYRGDAA